MNNKPIEQAKDRDLAGSIKAIRRAAKRARQVAAQTGTALIVWNGQRIERVIVNETGCKGEADNLNHSGG